MIQHDGSNILKVGISGPPCKVDFKFGILINTRWRQNYSSQFTFETHQATRMGPYPTPFSKFAKRKYF